MGDMAMNLDRAWEIVKFYETHDRTNHLYERAHAFILGVFPRLNEVAKGQLVPQD